MIIGYTNNRPVVYDQRDRTTRVSGTSIMMTGAANANEAIKQARRNLKSFVRLARKSGGE